MPNGYDSEQRLTEVETDTGGWFGNDIERYTLDTAGNRIAHSEAGSAWHYDANNRLTKVGNGNCVVAPAICYDYDEAGNRTRKIEGAKQTAEATQPIALDEDGNVTALDEAEITAQYGQRPESDFSTGVLFIKTKDSQGAQTLAYYHRDHLETPIQATVKTGRIVWSADYDLFGKATIITLTGSNIRTSSRTCACPANTKTKKRACTTTDGATTTRSGAAI